jgi:hypothetical protein
MQYPSAMGLNERDFFNEKQEMRATPLTCPRCKRRNEYQLRWVRRIKKDRIPSGADERDRALFAKLRDYMIRVDDVVNCQTCRTRFEVPSHQSLVLLQPGDSGGGGSRPGADDPDDDSRGNR